jgi:hypothetical protein
MTKKGSCRVTNFGSAQEVETLGVHWFLGDCRDIVVSFAPQRTCHEDLPLLEIPGIQVDITKPQWYDPVVAGV